MRSTSGITCCHFFCSAVFSMPVWRKPMVVSAVTIVSPDTCTTMFSTPCVLGCCGPMLTVIVSLRSSGMALRLFAFDQFAHRVHDGAVHFLHAGGVLVGHVDVNLGGAADAAAVASGHGDGAQPVLARVAQAVDHVRRFAAGRDAKGDVAAPPQRLELPHEHAPERVVVADRGEDAGVGG